MYIVQMKNVFCGDWKNLKKEYLREEDACLAQRCYQRQNDLAWRTASRCVIYRVVNGSGDVISEPLNFFGGSHDYNVPVVTLSDLFKIISQGADDWIERDNHDG